MTDCSRIEEKLSLYIDGELGARDAGLVEEHLAGCGRCSALLADLRKTKEIVGSLEEVEPPPWLTKKIMAGVTSGTESRKELFQWFFRPFHIKIPLEALAACLVAVLAVYVYRATGPETEALRGPLKGPEVSSPQSAAPAQKPAQSPLKGKEERGIAGADLRKTGELEKEEGFAPLPRDKATPYPAGVGKPPRTLSGEEAAIPGGPVGGGAGSKMEKAGPLKSGEQSPALEQKAVPAKPLRPEQEAAPSPSAAPARPAERARKAGVDRRGDGLSDAVPRDRFVIRVEADRIEAAAEIAEDRLKLFGARQITRESHGGFEVVEAELPAREINRLVEDLSRTFGVIQGETTALGGSEEMRAIHVEIRGNR